MSRLLAIAVGALTLAGCGTDVDRFRQWSSNVRTVITIVNEDIAATAPLVAEGCMELRKWAVLIQPFLPDGGKAPQYIGAANAVLESSCQSQPTNIAATAQTIAVAVAAAQRGYDDVSKGK